MKKREETRSPSYLKSKFLSVHGTHSHDTRSSNHNFHVEVASCPNSFLYTSIKEWNDLPNSLKATESEQIFKRKLHDHLSFSY